MACLSWRTRITRDLGVVIHGRIRHDHSLTNEVEESPGEML